MMEIAAHTGPFVVEGILTHSGAYFSFDKEADMKRSDLERYISITTRRPPTEAKIIILPAYGLTGTASRSKPAGADLIVDSLR